MLLTDSNIQLGTVEPDRIYLGANLVWEVLDQRVAYAPPAQTSPTVVNLNTAFYTATFADDEDVILNFPASVRVSSMSVTGGRHIRAIGGAVAKVNTGASLRFVGGTGSYFFEGLDIDAAGYNGDAINACGKQTPGSYTYPDVFIQNIRVTGVNGTTGTVHADIFQPQGPIGGLYVDKHSGRSGYQGWLIGPEFPIREAHFSRMDLGYEPSPNNITYLLWLFGLDELPFPVTLDRVYVQPKDGQDLAADAIAPWTGTTSTNPVINGQAIGAASDGAGGAVWPAVAKVTGRVKSGTPPRGDYVPEGSVGVGYVSPGYIGITPPVLAVPQLEAVATLPADITRSAASAVKIDATVGNPAPSLHCVGASAWWSGNAGSRWHIDGDFTVSYDININPDGAGTRDISNFGFWCNDWPSPNGFGLRLQAASGLNDAGWLKVTANTRTALTATAGSGALYNAGKINDLAQATWYRVTITMQNTVVKAKVVRLSDSVVVLDGFTLDLAAHIDASHLKHGRFGKLLDGVGSTQGHRFDNFSWRMP